MGKVGFNSTDFPVVTGFHCLMTVMWCLCSIKKKYDIHVNAGNVAGNSFFLIEIYIDFYYRHRYPFTVKTPALTYRSWKTFVHGIKTAWAAGVLHTVITHLYLLDCNHALFIHHLTGTIYKPRPFDGDGACRHYWSSWRWSHHCPHQSRHLCIIWRRQSLNPHSTARGRVRHHWHLQELDQVLRYRMFSQS